LIARMRNKLGAILSLSTRDWRLFWQAWGMLLVVDLGLRTVSYTRLQRMVEKACRGCPEHGTDKNDVIRQTWQMVEIASRNHLYAMTCLRRSLTLQWVLARNDIPTAMRFGVNKENDLLNAHAWLEYDGDPIGEPEALTERYLVLLELE